MILSRRGPERGQYEDWQRACAQGAGQHGVEVLESTIYQPCHAKAAVALVHLVTVTISLKAQQALYKRYHTLKKSIRIQAD